MRAWLHCLGCWTYYIKCFHIHCYGDYIDGSVFGYYWYIICLWFCDAWIYRGNAVKFSNILVRLLFMVFSSIPRWLWIPKCYTQLSISSLSLFLLIFLHKRDWSSIMLTERDVRQSLFACVDHQTGYTLVQWPIESTAWIPDIHWCGVRGSCATYTTSSSWAHRAMAILG
jgi:hypothetical protein